MKKLLYLFLLGLVIVSCNKEDDSALISAVSPVTEQLKEDKKIDLTGINATIDRLVINSKGRKSKIDVAGKANPVGSYIKVASTTTNGGIYYEFVFTDDIENCNPAGTTFDVVYLVLNAANFLEVRVAATDGFLLTTIERNLAFLFTLSFSEALKVEGTEVGFIDGGGATVFTF